MSMLISGGVRAAEAGSDSFSTGTIDAQMFGDDLAATFGENSAGLQMTFGSCAAAAAALAGAAEAGAPYYVLIPLAAAVATFCTHETIDGKSCYGSGILGVYICKDAFTNNFYVCRRVNGVWTCNDFPPGGGGAGAQSLEDKLNSKEDATGDSSPARAVLGAPKIDPAFAIDGQNQCYGTWQIVVPKSTSRTRTLRVDYGDGASETWSIPQGTGNAMYSFGHQYAPPPPPYYLPPRLEILVATLVETDATSMAFFVHGQPHIEQQPSCPAE